MVEIEFSIGNKGYKVVRGIKPNIFEIYVDGVLLNQDAASRDYQEVLEKSILKLNYKSFTQIVILGSASFVPFMQLKPTPRREIIEDLLDIQIFSSMNNLVKQKLQTLKDLVTENKYAMDLNTEKLNIQLAHLEESKKSNDVDIQKKREEINKSMEQITMVNSDIEKIERHVNTLLAKITDRSKMETRSRKLIQIETKIEGNIKKLEKNISFYENNDTCSTCGQTIDSSFKRVAIEESKVQMDKQNTGMNEVILEINKVNSRMEEIQEILQHISDHNMEIARLNQSITGINNYINKMNSDIMVLSRKKDSMETNDSKLKELKEEGIAIQARKEELSIEKQYLEYSSNLLKDTGIKTRIIKQYLPIMNKLINKYLQAMDSYINFNLDENFEETMKSRFRDEFSYHSFSEGEKLRIDLAILFTWRQIAKLKNSTNTNLLILDEVFDSSLDVSGTEEFLKLLREVGSDINVFVISHKGDQLFDKFNNVIRFTKKSDFSRIL